MRQFLQGCCAVAAAVCVAVLSVASAEVAPPGQYLHQGTAQFGLTEPRGNYRTRLAWLIASRLSYDQLGFLQRGLIPRAKIHERYDQAIRIESAFYAAQKGLAHYRYAEALVRDFTQIQLMVLQDGQIEMALRGVPASIIADVAGKTIVAGISELVPAKRKGLAALQSRFIDPATEADIVARYALIDAEKRYREFISPRLIAEARQQLEAGAPAREVAKLFSESAISAGIETALGQSRGQTQWLFDVWRRQMVIDTATYGCACALDYYPGGVATEIHKAVLGSTGDYRTPLAFLLSLSLAPPPRTLLNLGGAQVRDALLKDEQAHIERIKKTDRAAYSTYLRSLLIDLETLETVQIQALRGGAQQSFIENMSVNLMFGIIASPGTIGFEVAAVLLDAGYGALQSYRTISAEMRIRIEMAALREKVLDELLPLAGECGCAAGVVVVPETVVKGEKPNGQ